MRFVSAKKYFCEENILSAKMTAKELKRKKRIIIKIDKTGTMLLEFGSRTEQHKNKWFTRVLFLTQDSDDVEKVRDIVSGTKHCNITINHTQSVVSALSVIEKGEVDVVLADLFLPDSSGTECITRLHSVFPDIPIIMLSREDDEETAIKSLQCGAQDYLVMEHLNPSMLSRVIQYSQERQRLMAKIRSLSLVDELSGLYNLRGFLTLAMQQHKQAMRSKNGFFVFFFDIDNMKTINDSYGHAAGDVAIIQTAKFLECSFRRSDILARTGGDEFAVLSVEAFLANGRSKVENGKKDKEYALSIILRRIEQNLALFKGAIPGEGLSISYGWSEYSSDRILSIDELLALADKRMYECKEKRKRAA
jgi:diguanylate cyclase (GGDEF)-like protein